MGTKLIEADLETDLVPSPAQYSVLLPDEVNGAPLPVLLFLHGGGGSRDFLKNMRGLIESLWQRLLLPPMLVATPSAARGFYMDYCDGSQRWESFVLGPFLDSLRSRYGCMTDKAGTFALGVSMGGMGVLRMAFRHPERFAAVAALEPGIEPALEWSEVTPRHKFWRGQELLEQIYGSPFDESFWKANHPPALAVERAEQIRESNLQIYVECGDEDWFYLHEGTEFLHRILWEERIPHEYHLVRGANHVGRTLPGRFAEAFEFLSRVMTPPGPDPAVEDLDSRLGILKARVSSSDK